MGSKFWREETARDAVSVAGGLRSGDLDIYKTSDDILMAAASPDGRLGETAVRYI